MRTDDAVYRDVQGQGMFGLLLILVAVAAGFFGYVVGVSLASVECREKFDFYIRSLPKATPVPVAVCDTDMDCLEKFGCGGYADPCEKENEDGTAMPKMRTVQ